MKIFSTVVNSVNKSRRRYSTNNNKILKAKAEIRNLGDVKWLATEDRSQGKGTGRHIACFVLKGKK